MSSEPAHLIVLSGPTASGKSTLWRHLVRHPRVTFSVSATTRSPRPGEEDGFDYHFLSKSKFAELVDAGSFLEWARVHEECYGTLKQDVEKALAGGDHVLLEIDVRGAEQIRQCGLPYVSLFIAPPCKDTLVERLRKRGTEAQEEVERRLAVVDEEMSHAKEFDHLVVNDDLQKTLAEVEALLGLEVPA